jgi:hypothetical protein
MALVKQLQAVDRQKPQMWIAADYHFPSTYSCRIPMSSMNSASVMPAPGPATVRLALIKTGIECFGLQVIRDELFPILRLAVVRVRPPERVAISQQILRAYKWSEDKQHRKVIQESIIVREMAHAYGPMTIFLQIPVDYEQRLRVVLQAIGYWGQTSSLTTCVGITHTPPVYGECATPLTMIDSTLPLQPYFSCLATEFRSDQLSWYDIVPDDDMQRTEALHLEVYVWPMITKYRHGAQKLLVRAPLTRSAQ